MYFKYLLVSLVFFMLFLRSYSNDECHKDSTFGHSACGSGCTGTPACSGTKCGNVDNICYCDCSNYRCKPTALGWKWNKGIKLKNNSYALNGTKGDGREYICYVGILEDFSRKMSIILSFFFLILK